ncbi:MAG: ABC transporter permease [Deltaproteobacteria bacterium]|nr:ABC transporter permease [Deltaproteobacteria bacterium]
MNGPQDLGNSNAFWTGFLVVMVWMVIYPFLFGAMEAYDAAFFLINIPLALGVSLLWGYGGVLSFGQVAFFGIAGYAYGIMAGNFYNPVFGTLLGALLALLLAGIVAAVFGYFIFYGRVKNWILPVMTLVFTLVVEKFMAQTAGYQWKVGRVLLGGYNGMTGIPSLKFGDFIIEDTAFYYMALGVAVFCFLGLRVYINSHSGVVITAIREDELRTEMLGYDIRLVQVKIFIIAALLAGLSGLLYVQWGNYINPSSMGLLQASLPVVWVAVGGRSSFIAVVICTYLLNYIGYQLAAQGNQYAFLIMGTLLVCSMVFFPEGAVVMFAKSRIGKKLGEIGRKRKRRAFKP